MNAMQNAVQTSLRGFMWALVLLWCLQCIAAAVYSQQQGIPTYITVGVVPAFLLETGLYLAAGLRPTRAKLERFEPARLATAMTLSAPAPYLVYSLATGVFSWQSLFQILGLAGLASFWFVVAGRRTATDLAYLVLMAAPVLLKVFPRIYDDPFPRLQLFVLGVLMWYRTGLLAVLSIRKMEGINFGFVPRKDDWAVGIRNFLYFLPLGLLVGYGLDFFSFRPALGMMLPVVLIGTFVVTLWVLATAEEFFFRGLLQQLLTRLSGKEWVGLLAASIIFGLAHVRPPNWKLAVLATCAGLFYGRAYIQARSIRAAMVTHALVVTVWKVFLTS
jgi:membrane protease YdiL (CAAX protease family)